MDQKFFSKREESPQKMGSFCSDSSTMDWDWTKTGHSKCFYPPSTYIKKVPVLRSWLFSGSVYCRDTPVLLRFFAHERERGVTSCSNAILNTSISPSMITHASAIPKLRPNIWSPTPFSVFWIPNRTNALAPKLSKSEVLDIFKKKNIQRYGSKFNPIDLGEVLKVVHIWILAFHQFYECCSGFYQIKKVNKALEVAGILALRR